VVSGSFPNDDWFRFAEQVRRIQEQVIKALPPETTQGLAERLRKAIPPEAAAEGMTNPLSLSPQAAERLAEHLQKAFPPEATQLLAEQLEKAFPSQRIAEQFAQLLPKLRLDALSITPYTTHDLMKVRLHVAGLTRPGTMDLTAAARELEAEVEDADGTVDQPLGVWLISREWVTKLKLLVAALQVLSAASKVLEQASGEDIPDSLQAVAATCFAVVTFLTMVLDNQLKKQDAQDS